MPTLTEVPLPAPVPVTVQRYECPFCKRRRSAKRTAAEHIARCWRNPAARACKTCEHWVNEPGGEPCFPGRHCDCNSGYADCRAGVEGVDKGEIKTGCPLWQAKDGAAA